MEKYVFCLYLLFLGINFEVESFICLGCFFRFHWVATMSRVYVGNLDQRVSERDLEDEFRMYGVLRR